MGFVGMITAVMRRNQMSMQAAKSKSLPFMPQPAALDGTMAGENRNTAVVIDRHQLPRFFFGEKRKIVTCVNAGVYLEVANGTAGATCQLWSFLNLAGISIATPQSCAF